ncbi:MAG: zf-HC2 domain-containing protein [Pyrinomonadaceae bacterium]
MNCEECKNLLGVFMDNDLEETQASVVRMHLGACPDCARVCEELTSILDVCATEPASEIIPPNSHALWCRINNIIESEINPEPPPPVEVPRRRFWHLSLPQLAAAVLCIAIVSSVGTLIVLRNYSEPASDDFTSRSAATQTTFEKVLSKVGLMDDPYEARERRLKEQHAAIEYWNTRVQARRSEWDGATRDAFDRNLRVINESVNEYTSILQRNPDDDLSGEMLDTVLNEKMSLLRDFSDL